MKKPKNPFVLGKLGVSYTISAVIMTATAITLTLVAASYAYQILEQQRGANEFDATMKSILAFNDALENIAWKPNASRSSRFTVNYGQLELIPNQLLEVNVDYADEEGQVSTGQLSTGYVRYSTRTKYANFGEQHHSYFLGNNMTLSTGAGTYGRGVITQNSGWIHLTLMYGVRAMKASTIETAQGTVNNVDIWIIAINIAKGSTNIGTFDIKAKCLDVTTLSWAGKSGNGYPVVNGKCNIAVQLGDAVDTAIIELDGDKVVFNFVIATVQVSL